MKDERFSSWFCRAGDPECMLYSCQCLVRSPNAAILMTFFRACCSGEIRKWGIRKSVLIWDSVVKVWPALRHLPVHIFHFVPDLSLSAVGVHLKMLFLCCSEFSWILMPWTSMCIHQPGLWGSAVVHNNSLWLLGRLFFVHPPFFCTLPSPLHKSTSSDRWPRSVRKGKGHPITGGPPRQVGSVHLAPGARNEFIRTHLPGHFFSI